MSILVGHLAPDFTAPAVLSTGEMENSYTLSQQLEDKYGVIFFYPLDFTFVCPSELIALDHRINEFKKRHVEVIAVSVDSQFTHHAWRETPINKGGIGRVQYTMVADMRHTIARAYGVEHAEMGVALRGVFILDKKMIVRSQTVNDLPIGRNIDEIIRTIDALQFAEMHGDVCPAGWRQGDRAIKPNMQGISEYLAEHAEAL